MEVMDEEGGAQVIPGPLGDSHCPLPNLSERFQQSTLELSKRRAFQTFIDSAESHMYMVPSARCMWLTKSM